jgi:hypothetical protein
MDFVFFIAPYPTIIVDCPAKLTVIVPPHMQRHCELSVSAGCPPICTVKEPGDQGAAVLGIQGIGVSTPKAAAVAAATVGLERELHIPNGKIFTRGLLFIMFAIGKLLTTLCCGNTISTEGAAPNVQHNIAPPQTLKPIFIPPCK